MQAHKLSWMRQRSRSMEEIYFPAKKKSTTDAPEGGKQKEKVCSILAGIHHAVCSSLFAANFA